jgi:hypothetical protein
MAAGIPRRDARIQPRNFHKPGVYPNVESCKALGLAERMNGDVMSTRQQKFLVPPEVPVPLGVPLAVFVAVPVFQALRWIAQGVRDLFAEPAPTLKAEHE